MNISTDIFESIQHDKLVFFIGSGFSKVFDFPDWKGLIITVLEELKKNDSKYEGLINSMEFFSEIEILEKIKSADVGNKRVVYKVLENTFQLPEDKERLVNHQIIGDITSKIITTNYDKSIETANPTIKKIEKTNDYHLANLDELDEYILKLHGSVDEPSNCVLFREDYDKLYSNNSPIIERLKNIISDNTIIFLGFSLSDPFVKMQFEYIYSLYKGLGKTHYMVTTQDEKGLEKFGVSQIKLDSWANTNDFLQLLLEKKKVIVK
ncbi:SIR2 family protein [Bacillus toyonensis]|uniref:SIR2 family protein n=1 Tax=Bacillus toyonensis TaxID=155322 RepID=UPI00259F117A|nr:SIR2 family protein [Bacillus toyonensis]MDM5257359.1 SIR2 family protein [Bacillus toyonensis]